MLHTRTLPLVLAGTLAAQTRWTEIKPNPVPPDRQLAPIAFDAHSGRTVMFAGLAAQASDATWTWDGRTWRSHLPTARPAWRWDAPMFFDPVRRTVVLFGGHHLGRRPFAYGDTWEWDGIRTTWTKLTPRRSPTPRYGHVTAYAPDRKEAVLFGGYSNGVLGDTWVWQSAQGTWIQRNPATSPKPRTLATMVYDTARNRAVLFGGWPRFSDTWEWDGTNWTERKVSRSPGARFGHSMVYDELRQRVVLFGGTGVSSGFADDTWEWDGTSWIERKLTSKPSPRTDANVAWDSRRQRLVLFGGGTRGPIGGHWEYATVNPATFATFGAGCAGSAGVPALRTPTPQLPWIGDTFAIEVTPVPSNAGVAVLFGSSNARWGTVTLPLSLRPVGMPGCALLVSPDFAFPAVSTGGVARHAFALPNDTALAGVGFFQQAIVADPRANAAGLITSNGGDGRIGVR